MNILVNLVISHHSLTPLHTQLQQQIRELILSGEYPVGSRLPSENQLQQHLSVSRNTVRQALNSIESEGLIERIPGKGTFVAGFQKPLTTSPDDRRTIHFSTHDFENTCQRLLLTGAESVARSRGYRTVFYNSKHSPVEEERLLDQIKHDQSGGILMWSTLHPDIIPQLTHSINEASIPCVMMDRTLDSLNCDFVASDNYGGARAVMQHLIDLGHERIAFLTHPFVELLPVAERLRAYREALVANDLEPLEIWQFGPRYYEMQARDFYNAYDNPYSIAIQAVTHYLKNNQVTAVFAIHDYMALLAMKAAKLLGLRVPDDLSIAGFDDADIAPHVATPLTSVHQDTLAIGQRAASFLIDRMEGYDGPRRWDFIPATVRVRASTGPYHAEQNPMKRR